MCNLTTVKHKRLRRTKAIIFMAILASSAFYFAVVLTNTPFPIINPAQQPVSIPIEFAFYQTPHRYPQAPDILFQATLKTNQTSVVEGKSVSFNAFAMVNFTTFKPNQPNLTITSIVVGFKHAYRFDTSPQRIFNGKIVIGNASQTVNYTIPQGGDELLLPITAVANPPYYPDILYVNLSRILITWPVAGDYAPFFVLNFADGHPYSQFINETSVHVDTISSYQQVEFAKVNQGLTIALVFFALVELGTNAIEALSNQEPPAPTNPLGTQPAQRRPPSDPDPRSKETIQSNTSGGSERSRS